MTLGVYMLTILFGFLLTLGIVLLAFFSDGGLTQQPVDREARVVKVVGGLSLLAGIGGLASMHGAILVGF